MLTSEDNLEGIVIYFLSEFFCNYTRNKGRQRALHTGELKELY